MRGRAEADPSDSSASGQPLGNDPSGDDTQLVEAMESFLAELEAGRRPDRQEFLSRFPEKADQLEEHLEGLELLHAVTPQIHGARGEGFSSHPHMTLGDFRLVREIGRGGMGVVYQAEQLSLGRPVAVKVLPFAALLDERQLKRFRNEARAAASLDHPHIVPIYAVGQERGIHYYAMRLVEGQSLAGLVADLRTMVDTESDGPTPATMTASFSHGVSEQRTRNSNEFFMSIAHLGIQVAEALEHAHGIGILHRDIKPGNLLVDVTGHLQVTDFGLAQFEHGETLTRTGGVVGTGAYMSPEQASGSRTVDGRTDIYSLGATLYELIVLRRAQPDAPVHFRNVVPLRRLDSRTPRDLETIVMKAVSIEVTDRYLTAHELADDLRRFLAGRAIHARPPSPPERAARWLRRHRRLTAVCCIFMSLLLVAVVVGMAWYTTQVAQHAAELKSALESRERAVARARRLLRRAQDSELKMRRLSYRSDLEQAYQLWNTHNEYAVSERLRRQIPDDGQVDLRGIEWRLLNAELRSRQTVLGSHRGMATECALFPDQRTAATVGEDGLIHIWDLPTRSRTKSLDPGCGSLHALAVSPDGKTLAVGGTPSLERLDLGLLHIVDVETGTRREQPLQQHATTIESTAFSPDGQLIAAGSRYSEVQLSRIDGELLYTFSATSRNQTVVFSPSGHALAALHSKQIIRVWECSTGRVLHEIPYHHSIGQFRWSPTQPLISVHSNFGPFADVLEVNGPASAEDKHSTHHACALILKSPLPRSPSAIAYSPDGSQVVAGDVDGNIRKWMTRSVESLRRARRVVAVQQWQPSRTVHSGIVTGVAVTADADVLTTCEDGTVVLCRDAFKVMQVGDCSALAVDSAGTRYFSGDDTGTVRTGDFSQRPPKEFCTVGRSIDDISVSANGSFVGIIDDSGAGYVFETATGRPVWKWSSLLGIESNDTRRYQIVLSSDGQRVAVTGPDEMLVVWDVAQRQQLWDKRQVNILSIVFAADRQKLAYGGYFETLNIVDVESGAVVHSVRGGVSTECVDFSPDSRLVVAGNDDGGVRVADVSSGQSRILRGHRGYVRSVTFSADGQSIVSLGADPSGENVLRIWDTATGEHFGVLRTGTMGRRFRLRTSSSSLILFNEFGGDHQMRRWQF